MLMGLIMNYSMVSLSTFANFFKNTVPTKNVFKEHVGYMCFLKSYGKCHFVTVLPRMAIHVGEVILEGLYIVNHISHRDFVC